MTPRTRPTSEFHATWSPPLNVLAIPLKHAPRACFWLEQLATTPNIRFRPERPRNLDGATCFQNLPQLLRQCRDGHCQDWDLRELSPLSVCSNGVSSVTVKVTL